MLIQNLHNIFGETTNLNNKIYLLGILIFISLHIFFQIEAIKKNKLSLGITCIAIIFYIQFGLNPASGLGSHSHLDFEKFNSEVMTSNYKSNLYYLMQVPRCSSAKDIQFRFRKLSKLLHPDRKTKPLELKNNKVHISYEGMFISLIISFFL